VQLRRRMSLRSVPPPNSADPHDAGPARSVRWRRALFVSRSRTHDGVFDCPCCGPPMNPKSGGATAFSFSRLRPAGDLVASTGVTPRRAPCRSSGVSTWRPRRSRKGRHPRGAEIGLLRVDHRPSSSLRVKLYPRRMRNFNLSVRGDRRVHDGPVKTGGSYELKIPGPQVTGRSTPGPLVLAAIAQRGWACGGPPGMVFNRRINDIHPTPNWGQSRRQILREQPRLPSSRARSARKIDVGYGLSPAGRARMGVGSGHIIRDAGPVLPGTSIDAIAIRPRDRAATKVGPA